MQLAFAEACVACTSSEGVAPFVQQAHPIPARHHPAVQRRRTAQPQRLLPVAGGKASSSCSPNWAKRHNTAWCGSAGSRAAACPPPGGSAVQQVQFVLAELPRRHVAGAGHQHRHQRAIRSDHMVAVAVLKAGRVRADERAQRGVERSTSVAGTRPSSSAAAAGGSAIIHELRRNRRPISASSASMRWRRASHARLAGLSGYRFGARGVQEAGFRKSRRQADQSKIVRYGRGAVNRAG